jgi:hypothetical protein
VEYSRYFSSAGEQVQVSSDTAWADCLIAAAVGASPDDVAVGDRPGRAPATPTVRLQLESRRTAFERGGLRIVSRGAYSDGQRTVLLDAGGSGFDLLINPARELLTVTARYRPPRRTRAANRLLSDRFRLLAGQVLVHYPVLWRAGWRDRVPLHASVVRTAFGVPLCAGPSGVGKSTVLLGLISAGASATSDNLCAADPTGCFGLLEPIRAVTGPGPRTSHGRVERPMTGRVGELCPDRIVLLERSGVGVEVTAAKPHDAVRAMVGGTYAAGELRRYWAFAATLALATGIGPAHPPITDLAWDYASRVPCARVRVGDGARVTAEQLCQEEL